MSKALLKQLRKKLKSKASPQKAKVLGSFFKTGRGEYGEGDVFIGVTVPVLRKLAKDYQALSMKEIQALHQSQIHEERMLALLILMLQYQKEKANNRKKIFNYYLKNTRYINNWDLVDVSAPHVVGHFLYARNRRVLHRMARTTDLWKKRIAIVATFHFIRKNEFQETLKIAKILLQDNHDLIHKAVGWMLREVGKRNRHALENFLEKQAHRMPRTTLRYAIERFDEQKRKYYLKFRIFLKKEKQCQF